MRIGRRTEELGAFTGAGLFCSGSPGFWGRPQEEGKPWDGGILFTFPWGVKKKAFN
jgi:hypothetical protein